MFCFGYGNEAQCTSKDNTQKFLVIKKNQKDPQRPYARLHWNDLWSALLFVLLRCPEALLPLPPFLEEIHAYLKLQTTLK